MICHVPLEVRQPKLRKCKLAGRPVDNIGSQSDGRLTRVFHGAEFVPLKRCGEIEWSADSGPLTGVPGQRASSKLSRGDAPFGTAGFCWLRGASIFPEFAGA